MDDTRVARAGNDHDPVGARAGEGGHEAVVDVTGFGRVAAGAVILRVRLEIDEFVICAAECDARGGERRIAEDAEAAQETDVDDVTGRQHAAVEIRHQQHAHALLRSQHRHDVLQREGGRGRQVGEIQVAIALHQRRTDFDLVDEVVGRVDEELAHEPADVTGFVHLAHHVVVADDDDDRQIIVQERAPEGTVAHRLHLRVGGRGLHCQVSSERSQRDRRQQRDGNQP